MQKLRLTSAGCGIIYDSDVIVEAKESMFLPDYWREREAVDGYETSGRGSHALFINTNGARWVLRHYHRGGFVAKLSRDRYWWLGEDKTRAFHEWLLLADLYQQGLPVPRPIAAHYHRAGPTYTANIIVSFIPHTRSLTQRLKERGTTGDNWREVGHTIRRFHDEGVWHADLNADNVLIDDTGRVFLVDFDRGQVRAADGGWKEANLKRLHRSLEKRRRNNPDVAFTDNDWRLLLEGYEA